MQDIKDIEVDELVESFTEDEFGAVSAIYAWLMSGRNFDSRVETLGEEILKRAESDGTKA